MVGMMLESIATLIILMHTFLKNEVRDSPTAFFKRRSRSSRHNKEMAIAIIKGLSGDEPNWSAMYENRKLNRVVPPIIR